MTINACDIAVLIAIDGSVQRIDLDSEGRMSLDALQRAVGGYVRSVTLLPRTDASNGLVLWCDEDAGLMGDVDVSPVIAIVPEARGRVQAPILGPVVLTGDAATSGATLGLSEEAVTRIESSARAFRESVRG